MKLFQTTDRLSRIFFGLSSKLCYRKTNWKISHKAGRSWPCTLNHSIVHKALSQLRLVRQI